MTRAWLAAGDGEASLEGAAAVVAVRDGAGRAAGHLAAWRAPPPATAGAWRVDPRIVDPAGAAARVSLVVPPPGVVLPFDDPAVQHARRRVLAEPRFDAVSTLLRDASHFAGAITVARGADQRARLADEPFARLFPALVLEVGAGLLGRVAPPAGPVIERYGSARPWPWDRFGSGVP